MSAISIPAPVDLEVAIRPRAAAIGLPGTLYYPPIAVKPRKRARVRAANMIAAVLLNGVVITVIAAGTYVASGFAGSVELEAANRDALHSMDRANAATVAESGLRHAVDNLVSDDTVQRWATFNRFNPPYKLSTPLGGIVKK